MSMKYACELSCEPDCLSLAAELIKGALEDARSRSEDDMESDASDEVLSLDGDGAHRWANARPDIPRLLGREPKALDVLREVHLREKAQSTRNSQEPEKKSKTSKGDSKRDSKRESLLRESSFMQGSPARSLRMQPSRSVGSLRHHT